MALMPGISPWQIEWSEYTGQELEHAAFLVRADIYGFPAFLICYLIKAWCVTDVRRGAAAAAEHNRSSWKHVESILPQLKWLVEVALAVLAIYVLALHCLAMPTPTASQHAYHAQSSVGRWIYLTRQCLTLQAVHQTLSLFAHSSSHLSAVTHGTAVWIAALGFFVTMQYFLLVVPSKGFQEECQAWHRKGVHFEEVSAFLHIPAAVIAFVDLLFVRNPLLMHVCFSLRATLILTALYTVSYLGLVVGNYQMTGHWPYAMMEEYGTDPYKWAFFVCRQMVVISALVVVGSFLTWLRRPRNPSLEPSRKED